MWLAVVVNVEFLGPTKLDDFRFWLVIFFDILLLLKLQKELRGIHAGILHVSNLESTFVPWSLKYRWKDARRHCYDVT